MNFSAKKQSTRSKTSSSTSKVDSNYTATTNTETCVIMAIMYGAGKLRQEVGMAIMDLYYPHMIVCQLTDTYVYSNTLTKINIFTPSEVLMQEIQENDGPSKYHLQNVIKQKFPNINITQISRVHFNSPLGLELIHDFCTAESTQNALDELKNKKYALAAVSVLLKYINYIQKLVYEPNTIRLDVHHGNLNATINMEAIDLLEVTNSLNVAVPKFSLFTALNKCVTSLGKKYLRSLLHEPSCDPRFIQNIHECIKEIHNNKSLLLTLPSILKKFHNIEKLLKVSLKTGLLNNIKIAEQNISYILYVKSAIDLLPELRGILETTTSFIFKRVLNVLNNDRFIKMIEIIEKFIKTEATSVTGFNSINLERCFAIKPKICEILDVVRQAFCEILDDMIKYVNNLSQTHNLLLAIGCNSKIGYYIQLTIPKKTHFDITTLPKELVVIKNNGNSILLTTDQFSSDGKKCKELSEEIQIMSNVILENVLKKIRSDVDCFFQLCADIGELDYILSIAQISGYPGFIQPTFGTKLCLIKSYHPTTLLMGPQMPIPNNVVASIPYNFQLITGPNLSGKTTYLKQILLLHILAQIGCYVPAFKAEFRLSDRLFYHSASFFLSQNMLSPFEVEIKSVNFMIDNLTPNTFIIMDEPLSTLLAEDGIPFAHAICHALFDTTAFIFCSTHFMELTKLANIYYNITNLYFDCQLDQSDKNPRMIYNYKVKIGVTPIKHYGLITAASLNLPSDYMDIVNELFKEWCPPEKEKLFESSAEENLFRKLYAFAAKAYHNLILTNNFRQEIFYKLLCNHFSYEDFINIDHEFFNNFDFDEHMKKLFASLPNDPLANLTRYKGVLKKKLVIYRKVPVNKAEKICDNNLLPIEESNEYSAEATYPSMTYNNLYNKERKKNIIVPIHEENIKKDNFDITDSNILPEQHKIINIQCNTDLNNQTKVSLPQSANINTVAQKPQNVSYTESENCIDHGTPIITKHCGSPIRENIHLCKTDQKESIQNHLEDLISQISKMSQNQPQELNVSNLDSKDSKLTADQVDSQHNDNVQNLEKTLQINSLVNEQWVSQDSTLIRFSLNSAQSEKTKSRYSSLTSSSDSTSQDTHSSSSIHLDKDTKYLKKNESISSRDFNIEDYYNELLKKCLSLDDDTTISSTDTFDEK